MTPHVISVGNLLTGIILYGPFDGEQEAIEWGDWESETASGLLYGRDWVVVEVRQPAEQKTA